MKVYVELKNGMVTGAYTDDSMADIDFILCDHDDADQETEGDGFNFDATNACNDLESKIDELTCIFWRRSYYMTVRGLFTHFYRQTNVIIFESQTHKQRNIISWTGKIDDLINGNRSTYAYCKVFEWHMSSYGRLEIIIK